MLLDIISEQPDQSHTLQKHFYHLLTSVWKTSTRKMSLPHKTTRFYTSRDPTTPQSQKMKFTNLTPMSRLVAEALDSSQNIPKEDRSSSFNERRDSRGVGELGITLEFPSNDRISLPSVVSVSINDSESVPSEVAIGGNHHFRSCKDTVECRFRYVFLNFCLDNVKKWRFL